MEGPYNLMILLLGIYQKECDPGYDRATCTPKLWKKSRCPITDEQIKKMWYIYTMVLQKNEIILFSGRMELKNIILSDISQRLHVFPCMWRPDLKVRCIYRYIYDHIYVYTYSERETKLY
jgi:hypothetical protein